MITLGDGTDESHRRMQAGIDDLWTYTGEMFVAHDADAPLVQAGIVADHASLREPWEKHVDAVLTEATLERPRGAFMQKGGTRGVHSEHLGYLLAEMQFLQRSYPNATW